ncbi:hypothetical protein [Entomomonas asaccharolytica]|uniref:Uncharacterized protein n=1 Tax=Entomomonas asaccharolytica TaxID=2785331 RepID=A0A974NGB3_9GAMM|nr:hypothetical protein [Entomomonas asaccharolytica]QQP86095.1 hypothetical protein JHT90_02250 [Entomomonas asaccharolytica]
MRLINSRQAWHDAYYPNIKSTTAFGLEALKLGIVLKHPLKHHNHYQLIHQWLAGKVQHSIDVLPIPLQCFGHYLYSPIATVYDLDVAHELVWSILSKQFSQHTFSKGNQQKAYWLVRVALKGYQMLVVNKKDHLKTPRKIIKYIKENYQIELQYADWKKVWQPLYNNMLFICNELDKQALMPIDKLIEQFKKTN